MRKFLLACFLLCTNYFYDILFQYMGALLWKIGTLCWPFCNEFGSPVTGTNYAVCTTPINVLYFNCNIVPVLTLHVHVNNFIRIITHYRNNTNCASLDWLKNFVSRNSAQWDSFSRRNSTAPCQVSSILYLHPPQCVEHIPNAFASPKNEDKLQTLTLQN